MSIVDDVLAQKSYVPVSAPPEGSYFVTGACGSIGSAILARFSGTYIGGIALPNVKIWGCDADEDAVARQSRVMLGDFPDTAELASRETHVIHTAAYKHLPLSHDPYSRSAYWKNNVEKTVTFLGNLCSYPKRKMETFLLISTDKAAGSSELGATKKAAEAYVVARGFHALRLVNVSYSRGSVLDRWKTQEVLRIPDSSQCMRYFMSAQDATQLIFDVLRFPPGLYTACGFPEVSIRELGLEVARRQGMGTEDMPLRLGEVMRETLSSADEETETLDHPYLARLR